MYKRDRIGRSEIDSKQTPNEIQHSLTNSEQNLTNSTPRSPKGEEEEGCQDGGSAGGGGSARSNGDRPLTDSVSFPSPPAAVSSCVRAEPQAYSLRSPPPAPTEKPCSGAEKRSDLSL